MLERGARDPKMKATAVALAASAAVGAAKVARERSDQGGREDPDRYRLKSSETPHDGVVRIARGQLELTIGLLESAPHQEDGGEAVHEARKALKRLRALLRVSRGPLDGQLYRHENLILRDVGRSLSATRDAQVLLDTLDSLSRRYADGLRDSTWSSFRDSLATAVEQSRTLGASRSTTILGVLADARERAGTWPLPRTGGPASLAGGFARLYRRGRRAYLAAGSDPSAATLHELRKRAKDLWHASELLHVASPRRMKPLKRRAHRLSDLLGEDHDLTILREHAKQCPERLSPIERELLTALVGHRQRELRREALDCAAELYQEKPKRLLEHVALR